MSDSTCLQERLRDKAIALCMRSMPKDFGRSLIEDGTDDAGKPIRRLEIGPVSLHYTVGENAALAIYDEGLCECVWQSLEHVRLTGRDPAKE